MSADTPPTQATTTRSTARRLINNHVRLVLVAIVMGALITGGTIFVLGGFRDGGDIASSSIGKDQRGPTKNAFNQSVPGDCLTWPRGDPGKPARVDCGEQHYFEVAGVVDTSTFPGSEFSSSAPWPGNEWFAAFRDEHCPAVVSSYLNGKLDPNGKFSAGLMYPSQAQWAAGERALRCGLQLSDADGKLQPFLGKVADQDQSMQWPVGTCVGVDERHQPTEPVECSEPHAFQVTGIVDLANTFGARNATTPAPSIDKQNNYLTAACSGLTDTFFGGNDKFAASTLNVQWSTISAASWAAGSRISVCYVGLPGGGGFATLTGDARHNLLINGKGPATGPAQPPGRRLPTAVPLPPGVTANPTEVPAPIG